MGQTLALRLLDLLLVLPPGLAAGQTLAGTSRPWPAAVHTAGMAVSIGTKTLDLACGAFAVALFVAGLVSAIFTGWVAFVLTVEGISFWRELLWAVTAMCVLAPTFFLYAYDAWQRKKGLQQ
jgi:hypothetical protein